MVLCLNWRLGYNKAYIIGWMVEKEKYKVANDWGCITCTGGKYDCRQQNYLIEQIIIVCIIN